MKLYWGRVQKADAYPGLLFSTLFYCISFVNFSEVVRVKEVSNTGIQEIQDRLQTNCQCVTDDVDKVS